MRAEELRRRWAAPAMRTLFPPRWLSARQWREIAIDAGVATCLATLLASELFTGRLLGFGPFGWFGFGVICLTLALEVRALAWDAWSALQRLRWRRRKGDAQ